MTDSVPVGINSMPEEIRDQIIRGIPIVDLPNGMLASRTFCRQARPHFYKSVHFIQSDHLEPPQPFISMQHCTNSLGNFDPTQSARIVQPDKFLSIISDTPSLRYQVAEISFSIHDFHDDEDVKALKRCLDILRPESSHLTLPFCQMELALSNTVTSLDIMYPTEEALTTWQETDPKWNFLREEIYAFFTIPTLLHLTLREARKWNAFSRVLTYPQYAGTSNVVSLSLPDTVPMDVDLQEILTWPKALRCYNHESMVGKWKFFQQDMGGRLPSSAWLLKDLAAQKESLEEVMYNHGYDPCGDDETLFDPILMREFEKLEYMRVPRECFVNDWSTSPNPLYMALPPRLEVLTIDQEMFLGDLEHEATLRGWLGDILDHKKSCFPALRSIVIVEFSYSLSEEFDFTGLPEVSERM
ncbi:hypothetical protein DL98DRAFT_591979 [Cadophora sp. DSE1049]|nr:hypothetical protein DL98DRAFT_591979 [Cadophora sp. DSE1049]